MDIIPLKEENCSTLNKVEMYLGRNKNTRSLVHHMHTHTDTHKQGHGIWDFIKYFPSGGEGSADIVCAASNLKCKCVVVCK